MTRKFLTKPKVTDGERRDRFVAMTQQIGALDDVKNFEKAFQKAFKSAFENGPARVQTANSSSSAFASFRSRVGSGMNWPGLLAAFWLVAEASRRGRSWRQPLSSAREIVSNLPRSARGRDEMEVRSSRHVRTLVTHLAWLGPVA
jgi:hypothetical protein